MADTGQTIIIKKIKKGAHGHHGGAWKVAYADFVTAMMAFFLLMWLLNATEVESLSGLADYFAPTVGVKDNMGIGFRGGKGALSKGLGADKNTNKGILFGGTPAGPIVKVTEKIEQETAEPEDEKLSITIGKTGTTEFQGTEKEVKPSERKETAERAPSLAEIAEALQAHLAEAAKDTGQQVAIVETPDGLEIKIQDTAGEPMFAPGTADIVPKVQEVLTQMAKVLSHLPNYIAITGHTSSVPVRGKKGYGNWELSADRANAARRLFIQSGVQAEQIERVIGKADNEPLDAKHPAAPVNNRISIILLKGGALPEHKKGAPTGVFLDPRSSDAKDMTNEEEAPAIEPKEEETPAEIKGDSNLKEDIKTLNSQSDEATIQQQTAEPKEAPQDASGLTRGEAASKALNIEEEKPKVQDAGPKKVNEHLLQENKAEDKAARAFEGTEVQDPIAGGNAIDPLKAVKEETPKAEPVEQPVNMRLIEEDKAEEKAAREFQGVEAQDPISGGRAVDPFAAADAQAEKEKKEASEKKQLIKPAQQHLVEEDREEEKAAEKFQGTTGADPFASGKAIDPFAAADEAAKKEKESQKKAPPAPAKAYLLAPDKDEKTSQDQFEKLPSQDPFGSGGGFDPLGAPPQ